MPAVAAATSALRNPTPEPMTGASAGGCRGRCAVRVTRTSIVRPTDARYRPRMTTVQVPVVRAARGDHQVVGGALAAAFSDDPVWKWLIPTDVADRDVRMHVFF